MHGSAVTLHGKGGLDGLSGGLAPLRVLPRLRTLSWLLSLPSFMGPDTAFALLVDVAAKFIRGGFHCFLKSWGASWSWAVSSRGLQATIGNGT